MNKDELLQRLADIEWEDFEVKTAHELPKSCWETVSAFSNTVGGWLILGVEKKDKTFSIIGVSNPEKIEQEFINTLNGQKFNVKIRPEAHHYTIDGKHVLAFYIHPSKQKPIYYNTQSNTFIRSGSGDVRATAAEIDAMYRDQAFGFKTGECVEGLTIKDLSSQSLVRYRDYMSRFNPAIPYNKLSLDEFLNKTHVMIDGKVTYAGLLFFGTQDAIFSKFPDFRIDLLEIPGTSYNDAEVRFTYRLAEQENLWEYYFTLFERISQKVNQPFKMNSEGFAVGNFPHLEALREALVNMLMHADYFSPMKSRVRIFTDRIEFFNPGCYPKPLKELLKSDVSIPRNPILAKLFRLVKLAENAGFGFDKMIDGWKTYTGEPPLFEQALDYTIVIFKLSDTKSAVASEKTSVIASEKTSDKIIEAIKKNSKITTLELSVMIKISSRSIERNLRALQDKNLIKRVGPKNGGHWEVINNN